MASPDRRFDLGNSLKSSIRQISDCQNFGGARVLIRELPSAFQAEHGYGISHYFFGYRPIADEPGQTVSPAGTPIARSSQNMTDHSSRPTHVARSNGQGQKG